MVAIESPRPRGICVLSRDTQLAHDVATVCAATRTAWQHARDLDELDVSKATALVVDDEHPDAVAALARAPGLLTVSCTRGSSLATMRGPRALVARSALIPMMRTITADRSRRPLELERLLAIGLIGGPIEHALGAAAEEIAAAFGAERCVISVRGDSTGAASGTQTWSSVAWSETADRCRVASAVEATLVGMAAHDPGNCESVMAAPLECGTGGRGFVGVIARGARIFTGDERGAIAALGIRLALDLDQRLAHERTLDELDRLASAPGIDAMLGIWNRPALAQLAAMYVSGAGRATRSLTAMVVDIVDLQSINNQHGVEIGDRVLHRVADALRAMVRTEDVVGRWAGDKIGVLLQGIGPEGARALAERIHAALQARNVELRGGGSLAIPVKLGISSYAPPEDAAGLLARAGTAAQSASLHGVALAASADGSTRPVTVTGEIGEELRGLLGGTYRLVHEISRGGMGVVYRAEDLALERAVAIKMLRPDLAEDHAFIEQLRHEAALLARVQHPNLVQVYSFGQVGGDSYFVMELVEGENLGLALERYRREREAMPVAELLALVGEIASALDTLHELGIVHRDVKPDNVIRDPFRGRSVLVDVGIARRFGQHASAAGTPGYVAPEVIRGEEATARSDVYGLAATTYALLALEPPWGEGLATEVLTRQLFGGPPPPVGAARPELAAVDKVLARALSVDPMQRQGSAMQLARELHLAVPASAPAPIARPRPITLILPRRTGTARTRGVVFRSLPRAFGARETGRLRDALGATNPELARVIGDAAPLSWLPTELLVELFTAAPPLLGRAAGALAHDLARASVRATFRRFFPAASATLAPERTLAAMRNIWSRYQSWGELASMPVRAGQHVVRIGGTLRQPELCAWSRGLIEQLVVLSGGAEVTVEHDACEARGDRACVFHVGWERG